MDDRTIRVLTIVAVLGVLHRRPTRSGRYRLLSLLGRNVELVTAEADHYHVNIPITGGTDSRSGRLERVQVTPQRAAVFMPGLPADIGWRGDCAQFCLMFPHRRLHHELEAMLDRPLARPIEFAPAMDLTTDRGRVMLGTIIRTPVAGK
ncbi:MAG TPA: hypothetical protein VGP04_07170 [Pseudonocardiaceae bacterium]|nr:hypothetical protein [Pseudonocardiaceae bacterium]